jgi:hypothetical protein
MTLDQRVKELTDSQLRDLQRVANKYGETGDLAVYSQFTYDVQGGEDMNNK